MKKKVLFSIALAGLMLGSCSKDVIDNGGNGASWNENGEGYVSLSLNLPTSTDGSRATFGDGLPTEYSVRDAMLILFTVNNGNVDPDANATINSAYNMKSDWIDDDDDQITYTAKIVQKINEIDVATNDIYALVVLNNNGLFTIADNGTSLKIGTGEELVGKKLSELNSAVAVATTMDGNTKWNNKGFLMSNSPLFNKQGGSVTTSPSGGKSSTLVMIKDENIFPTYNQAWESPAATIFVERAQAKVQVSYDNEKNKSFTINYNGKDVKYDYQITGWQLDNYNTNSNLTRVFDDTWAGYKNGSLYRFVEFDKVKENLGLYRTYWGKDVNYDTNTTTGLYTIKGKNDTPKFTLKNNDFDYCLENTTDYDEAKGNALTRILVSAQLKANSGDPDTPSSYADFFTTNDASSGIYIYGKKSQGVGSNSIEEKIKSILLGRNEVSDVIENYLIEGKTFDYSNLEVTFNGLTNSKVLNNENDIVVEVNNDNSIFNGGDFEVTIKPAIKSAINEVLKEKDFTGEYTYRFEYFQEGKCYYAAYIRHFNDTEADWNAESDTPENHLGRYGVLRNNWYVLTVNSIKNIGSSVVPELPENPVDVVESYLSVEINVLAWAKREQDVNL